MTEKQLIESGFLILTYGTTYGYRMVDGKRQVVFAVKFTPFKDMPKERLKKLIKCGQHFKRTFELFNPVKSNAAHKRGGSKGEMAAEGWRAGYEKEVDFGRYKIKATSKRQRQESSKIYADHTAEMKDIATYFEESFQELCPIARHHALEWRRTRCQSMEQ
ncbi:hypothetical protein FS749_002056 [Ceratobasidium sp. UAMH 11750]|nr:hypothetical protein FS749_002056 [Ceratobasidium sp. UAMH 11750]